MDEVIKYLQNLPEEKWSTMVGGWTVKDIVAHLVAWNYEAAREILMLLSEGGEAWFYNTNKNFDEFNAKAVERYKDFSPKELLEELKKSDSELDKIIEKYGAENLKNRPGFKWLFEKSGEKPHSIKHLDKIKEVLGDK